MKTFIFLWLLSSGAITPDGENNDRTTYRLNTENRIEHAYQGELIGMFQTGKFMYDEDLPDVFLARY